MILLLAGTKDARDLAKSISEAGHSLLVTVVTDEAAKNYREIDIPVMVGRKTVDELVQLIKEKEIKTVIDSTHPYAEIASINAIKGAKLAGVEYIRYERPSIKYAEDKNLHYIYSYEEAALSAKKIKGTIFLATGSKTLEIFTNLLKHDPYVRLLARILPNEENMQKCTELGIDKKDIIAIQGPFTSEFNRALFNMYNVDVLISKETGEVGSMDEKILTALEMGITTLIIKRPLIDYPVVFNSFDEVLKEIA